MWKETSLNLGQAIIPCLLKREDIADQYFPEKNVENDEIEDEVHLLFKCSKFYMLTYGKFSFKR